MGLFDFISKPIESILTAPGTNARRNQDERNSAFGSGVADVANSLLPLIQNQVKFGATLEPGRQSAIRNAIGYAQPGTQNTLAEKQVGVVNSDLADSITNLKNQFASAGLSAGAVAGGIGDLQNNATQQTNQIRGAVFDPAVQMKLQEQLAALAQQGQQAPGLNNLAVLGQLLYGQPQVHVGQGLGDILGGALGQWAGGGFKTPGSK